MIQKITAHGFKGWSGEQDIGERTLFVGPNGAGKSARSQALQLAVNGYVIGCGKKNEEILSSFGEGDKLVVGVQIDGTLFERGFVRAASGSVSQGYKVNGAKVNKDYFLKALGEVGSPVILNVADFMDLSDQKKIEALFQLYPPAGDVAAIQGKIDKTKERINALAQKIKTTETAAARIASSKAEIKVPAGTLAEVDAEIAAKEKELAKARNELVEARIAEQKAEDERRAKEEAERKERERLAKAQDEEKRKAAETAPPPITKEAIDPPQEPGPEEQRIINRFGAEGEETVGAGTPSNFLGPFSQMGKTIVMHDAAWSEVRASIQAIIASLDAAGCGACTARLVARRELKKYQEVANG